jgi:Tol biopolymer transport system component
MTARESVDEPFGNPVNLGAQVNSEDIDGGPALSGDALTLVFDSNRPGGEGDTDLWASTRPTNTELFGEPVNLGDVVNTQHREFTPWLSADGRMLIFSSTRPGGRTSYNMWMASRESAGEGFGKPVPLPIEFNRKVVLGAVSGACLSPDGLSLLFHGRASGGHGREEIWISRRPDISSRFGEPLNLGVPVNGGASESGPYFSANGQTLYFASDRPGGLGGKDLWRCSRVAR